MSPMLRTLLLTATMLAGAIACYGVDGDGDGDGVDDLDDFCPNTPPNIPVDAEGRPLGDLDLDCDVDMLDFALFAATFTGPRDMPEVCHDEIDNDGDELIDCQDPDCNGRPCGAPERYCIAGVCQHTQPEICDDNIDNNGDGLTDCEDPACDGQPCGVYGRLCIDNQCVCPSSIEICDDGIDNDCDGLVDCEDVADCPYGTPCGGANMACGPMGACICTSGYANCDGLPDNGCEVDLMTNDAHCGWCNNACDFPHADAACVGGACVLTGCDPGWCDLDGAVVNGCEFDLDTDPICSSAEYLGNIAGDMSSTPIVTYNRGERWYRISVVEADNNVFSPRDLGITVTLAPAPGTDYDLYAYCDDCVTLADSSAAQGDAIETVVVGWNDNSFSPDERMIYIKVAYWDASTCDAYSLQIEGNTPGPNNCPD